MIEHTDIEETIDQLAQKVNEYLRNKGIVNPVIVGIHTGGVWIAERLRTALGLNSELGKLDISFYRDDFTHVGINPQVKPSHLPFSLDDQHILLVDDVLFTGRTIRAALNELFDYGRPASITLAVLIERDGRELPIQADVAAMHLRLAPHEHIKLQGPDPLILINSENQ